jgi:hypothetical protein
MSHAAPMTTARDSGLTTPIGVGSVRLVRRRATKLSASDVLINLRDWAWLEARVEAEPSKQNIWLAVRDWANGIAAKNKIELTAPCPENREPLTDRDLSLSNNFGSGESLERDKSGATIHPQSHRLAKCSQVQIAPNQPPNDRA